MMCGVLFAPAGRQPNSGLYPKARPYAHGTGTLLKKTWVKTTSGNTLRIIYAVQSIRAYFLDVVSTKYARLSSLLGRSRAVHSSSGA